VVLVAGGERSGKSEWLAEEVVARVPWCERVAVAAEEYDESRKEMEYILARLGTLGAVESSSTPMRGQWIIRARGGCEIRSISLKHGPEELTGTGEPFDVVGVAEAGLVRFDVFLAALGRVAETRGVVLLSGTLHDSVGWYADLWRAFGGPNRYGGERFSFPTWANRAKFPRGWKDPQIVYLRDVLPADEFARRVAGEVLPSKARMYPEFAYPEHVGRVAFNPELAVELAVDAGYYPSHYAVLALQVERRTVEIRGEAARFLSAAEAAALAEVAPEALQDEGVELLQMEVVRQIDELWEHHLTHHQVIRLCRERPWWGSVTVAVGGHETRQHQAAASTAEVWQSVVGKDPRDPGRFRFEVFNAGRVLDGVTRVRTFLRDPRTGLARYQCDLRCVGTPHEFGAYKRRTDAAGRVLSDEPKDADNDALDALRNWFVYHYGLVDVRRAPAYEGQPRGLPRG
jgi:hypothetical protein